MSVTIEREVFQHMAIYKPLVIPTFGSESLETSEMIFVSDDDKKHYIKTLKRILECLETS